MHLNDDTLHAYLDGELDEAARSRTAHHLAGCQECQARHAEIAQLAVRVTARLSVLDPTPAEAPQPARQAIKALRRYTPGQTAVHPRPTGFKEKFAMFKTKISRPMWAALTLVAVLAIALSFQPVRALAGNFLSLFRVQQITLLPVDMSQLRGSAGEPTVVEAMARMFSDTFVITREGDEQFQVSGAAEASQAAGFPVRDLDGQAENHQMWIERGPAFEFTFVRDQAQMILDDAGKSDIVLPEDLDQVKVSVDIPDGVTTAYGDCEYNPLNRDPDEPEARFKGENCIHFIQMPSPILTTDPDVDAARLAEVGLRFLGMEAAEAESFSQSVDWATTLVIPFPRNEVDAQQVQVDGVTGNLLVENDAEQDNRSTYTLIWVKDGILYALTGGGDPQNAIELAGQLR